VEISAAVEANPISPTPWLICIRGGASEAEKRACLYYFFKNNDYASFRGEVIVDHCETQRFTPLKDVK
jgi:hypothetical protein